MVRAIVLIGVCSWSAGCASTCTRAHLRVSGGVVWAATNSATEPHRLWRVPCSGRVDALHVACDRGRCAVQFAQGGRRWRGAFDARTLAHDPLVALEAEPPQVSEYGQITPPTRPP
jgi:hypothetical protein